MLLAKAVTNDKATAARLKAIDRANLRIAEPPYIDGRSLR
jgi:hypothetical protein